MRKVSESIRKIKELLKSKKAEVFVSTGIKILISVVLGSALLAGTYTLTKDTVLETVNDKVNDLIGYEQASPGAVVEEEPKQVSFSIDGVGSFTAVEGMTWGEWIASCGISAGDNGIVWICYDGLGGYCTKSDVGRLCVDRGNGLGCNMIRYAGQYIMHTDVIQPIDYAVSGPT